MSEATYIPTDRQRSAAWARDDAFHRDIRARVEEASAILKLLDAKLQQLNSDYCTKGLHVDCNIDKQLETLDEVFGEASNALSDALYGVSKELR